MEELQAEGQRVAGPQRVVAPEADRLVMVPVQIGERGKQRIALRLVSRLRQQARPSLKPGKVKRLCLPPAAGKKCVCATPSAAADLRKLRRFGMAGLGRDGK